MIVWDVDAFDIGNRGGEGMYVNTIYDRIMDSLRQRGVKATLKKGLRHAIYSFLYREERKSFGSMNPNRTVYIIRGLCEDSRYYTGVGLNLLANFSYVLSHMLYAREKGWVPVVDQLHYPVYNQESFPVHGSRNPWEYYWQQPGGITLEDAYASRDVVLSARRWYEPGNLKYSAEAHMDRVIIDRFHALMETIPLNAPTAEYRRKCLAQVLEGRGRVLGVSMRAGGYSQDGTYHSPGHPIQPKRDELLELVEERMHAWNMDTVFLATEENENIECFQARFGNRLVYLPRERYDKWKPATKGKPNPLYMPGKRYQTGLDYLMEMELLAVCDSLLGSVTSGLRYAIFRNGGRFSHLEVLDFGRFPG